VKRRTIVESGAGGAHWPVTKSPKRTDGRTSISFTFRFDDRSFQTVAQASLDGFGIGDSVRIERDRVRRY
jgi:hypothetical protein